MNNYVQKKKKIAQQWETTLVITKPIENRLSFFCQMYLLYMLTYVVHNCLVDKE
jgi:hypothetical protein